MALPDTCALLVDGGDTRIALDPLSGLSQYGCRPLPDPALVALGSSTASLISGAGLAAADTLRRECVDQLKLQAPQQVYAAQLARLRVELLVQIGLGGQDRPEVVLSASGTDLFLLAADWLKPASVVMLDPLETGSGLKAALQGCHFNSRSAGGAEVAPGASLNGWRGRVVALAPREPDGAPRKAAALDAECRAAVEVAATAGERVLLILTDVSKSGLIVPAIETALALKRRWPELLEVIVDGCQLRLSGATLRAYLDNGFSIALSGSKFVAGPTFSGALLVPDEVARRHRDSVPSAGLRDYSNAAEWPARWAAAQALPERANFGLLLRWQAALTELRAFAAVPEARCAAFLDRFGDAVRQRLALEDCFQAVPVPLPDRGALGLQRPAQLWDTRQTIFPFLLMKDGRPLAPPEVRRLYLLLQHPGIDSVERRFYLGQPVACGESDGVQLSALRLCVSAPMVVAACDGEDAERAVIGDALAALDRLARLIG